MKRAEKACNAVFYRLFAAWVYDCTGIQVKWVNGRIQGIKKYPRFFAGIIGLFIILC